MNPDTKQTFALTDDLPQSSYSGLSELPEVKDVQSWLLGAKHGSDFRDMVLDDVIPQRKELPEWGKTSKQTLPEAIGKTLFSDKIAGGTGEGMNKVGEFFYNVKDSFATAISNIPTDVLRFVSAASKAAGISEKDAVYTLNMLDDLKTSQDFDKVLRDFRLGVDSNAFSNDIANVFGQMGSILIGAGALKGAGVAAKAAAGITEGLAEGGQYLATDIAAQRQKEGGLEEYKGQGLGFAAGYGTLAGLVGMKGVEAAFLDKMGKFTGKEVVKGVLSEAGEEIVQTGTERISRRTQNEIYGTDTDKQTWTQDLLETGKAGLLGAIGGATFGGVAFVNNRNRMVEMLQDNFGLTKADARSLANTFIEDSTKALQNNTTALTDLSPDSRVMSYAKETLVQDGMSAEEADRTLANMRKDIIKTQLKADAPLVDNDFFKAQSAEEVAEYVRNRAGIQSVTDSVVEEEKQAIADRRAELEAQQVEQPAEQKEVSKPVQLELNFLNAEENAINEAQGIKAEPLPVQQDLITQEQAQQIQDKLSEIDNKVSELTAVKTPVQAETIQVGKELNSFTKPEVVESQYTKRLAAETKTEVAPVYHNVRDSRAAAKAADELVVKNQDKAWDILESGRANTEGLLTADVAEALKRQINKISDPVERGRQLNKLATLYASQATRLGQELQSLSLDAQERLVDSVRDIAEINKRVAEDSKSQTKKKKESINKAMEVKKSSLPTDAEIKQKIREILECK